jgi:hypothetical protein
VRVVVVADLHFVRFDFFRQLVKHIGGVLPAFGRVVLVRIKPGNDQVFITDDFIELNSPRQVVSEQRIELGMGTAAFQSVIIQQLANVFCTIIVVTGEFDAVIANVGDGFDSTRQVLLTFRPDGIQLQAQRDFTL